jgi:hypothetical protein
MTLKHFIFLTLIFFLNLSLPAHIYGQNSQCAVITINNGMATLTKLDGKKINGETYFEIGECREGVWSALKIIGADTLAGFIDHNGIEHDFIFKNTFNFSEGHAVVQLENGKYSLINASFEKITDIQFDFLLDLREGFAPAKLNGKWTFLKPDGQLLLEPKYDDVFWFKNGFCSVKIGNLHGYINRQGELITEIKYINWREFSDDGLAFVSESKHGWNVIDTLGNFIYQDPDFLVDDVQFNEFGLVRIYKKSEDNHIKYGFADKKGNKVIPMIYDRIESFYYHPVTGAGILQKNGLYKYILIDTAGNQIGDVQFDHIHYYYGGGVSMVTTSYYNSKPIDYSIKLEDVEINYEMLTGKRGVIDPFGNILIPVIYEQLSPEYCYMNDDYFNDDCVFEAQEEKNGRTGVINDKGEVIVPFIYTFISINYIGNGLFYGTKSESEESFYDTKTRSEIKLNELKYDKQIRVECNSPLLVFLNKSNLKKGLKKFEFVFLDNSAGI